jgi:molecular chaperone DnaK
LTYRLGIDFGATFTTAAVCRPAQGGGVTTELVPLGARGSAVPSVLFLDAAGTTIVGEAAGRRALTDPGRVVREFKRRLGDETPVVVGGETHHAHDLAARLVRWVVDRVTEREGGPPDIIAITHPAKWGPHREALLCAALAVAGIEDVLLLTEPQAAALHYASAERIPPESVIAVYDLGGGTFDAAVLRKTSTGFEMLGVPDGVERLGGIDFDDMILAHVLAEVPQTADDCDMADPVVCSAISRLRRECIEAKEALSTDTEATIPVLLPQTRTQVRLVRSEFEALIRPTLEETIRSLERAVESAGLTGEDLSAVLLVGGSSRIPLVTQMISAQLQRRVSVDTDPKGAVAMGAALAAHHQITESTAETAILTPVGDTQADDADVAAVPPRPDDGCAPPQLLPVPRRRLRKTKITVGSAATLMLALWLIPSPFSLNGTSDSGGQPARAQTPASNGNAPTPTAPTAVGKGGNTPGATGRSGSSPDATAPGRTPAPGVSAAPHRTPAAPPVIGPTANGQGGPVSNAPVTGIGTNTPPPPATDTAVPVPTDPPTSTAVTPPGTRGGGQHPSALGATETRPPGAV